MRGLPSSNQVWVGVLALAMLCLGACNSASDPAAAAAAGDNALGVAMGVFGITSPVAQNETVVARNERKTTFWQKTVQQASLPLINILKLFSWKKSPLEKKARADDMASMESVEGEIEQILNADSVADCVGDAFEITNTVSTPACYGPNLTYQHHPDGADQANCGGSSYPCFPGGDLGLWTATEGGTGEACSVAKMNGVIQAVSNRVNSAQKAFAATLCLANLNKVALPAVGESVDLRDLLVANVSNATFTTATLSTLESRSGATATYQLVLDGLVNNAPFVLNLIHSPTNSENTQFKGHVFGKIGPNTSNVTAFSLTYEQGASNLNAVLKSGDMTSNTPEPFDGDNELDYTDANFISHSVYYHHINIDSDGLGTALSAWQANPNDSNTRVFNAQTSRSGSDDTGFAYFGFGDQITTSTDRGKISRMICNWAGPSNSHTGLANKAQGQAIERNGDGVFVPASGGNHITYAPTNSCDNASGTFAVGTDGTSAPSAIGTVNNELVDLNNYVGDLGTITVPATPSY